MTGNTNRGTTVGNTIAELINTTSFVSTSQTLFVVFTIDSNVFSVTQGHLFNSLFNSNNTTFLTHFFSREVCVATSAIPITLDRLRVDRNNDAKVFRDTFEKVTSSPEFITHADTFTGTNLEFELTRSDFSIDTRDVDASVQTGTVVSFDDVATKDLTGTYTTVVFTLRFGETMLGPTVGLTGLGIKEHVFLFHTEPRLGVSISVHHLLAVVAVIGGVRSAIRVEGLTDHKFVVATTERISV
ncbi:hypothetical protein RO3G_03643 [Rhizopus delemar RA 99-880]|uniref:Uncharacterized protein n=1 Tax=Rhizopus delemar (strain RA 99-880 / ATCC MYA-4621 / FGSC 9543 / NRRL 43880) TaxID=246409 RepID=I1BRV8_RHIO9|nr:hypothetical protein RO3G_03643 [Rhizopus delemar RA 99-880]|eukprot:EIE78938.1 hypothetical protein RO3G_03643 [Rhizopus delemar RA 99-880]